MIVFTRVRGEGWAKRWSASVRISEHGSVAVHGRSKRAARRRLLAITKGRTYSPPAMQRVLPGTRPRWPTVGQRIEEIGTGLVFRWDGARWVR